MFEIGAHGPRWKIVPPPRIGGVDSLGRTRTKGGMPRISDSMLDAVVFLYRSAVEAESRSRLGATAVLIAREIEGAETKIGQRLYVPYLVSNRHAVFDKSACVAAVNRKDGNPPTILDFDQESWIKHPDGDDLAAICVMGWLDPATHKINARLESSFVTPQIIEDYQIGIGDEVFMIGRFINHDGKRVNEPAARFGCVSVMLSDIQVPGYYDQGQRIQQAFAVEMRSRTGFSGSPVRVYRTMWSNLASIDHPQHGFDFMLGVNWGYILDEEGENTFLNGVVPAWKISELLRTPALQKPFDDLSARLENDPESIIG